MADIIGCKAAVTTVHQTQPRSSSPRLLLATYNELIHLNQPFSLNLMIASIRLLTSSLSSMTDI